MGRKKNQPKTAQPSFGPIEQIHGYGLDRHKFIIYLNEIATEHSDAPGVEHRMATRFIRNLEILSDSDPTRRIFVEMKTPGGDVANGMAIYDAIITCPNEVNILAYAEASSMSSVMLQAGVKRVMAPNSNIMVHYWQVAHEGTINQIRSYLDFLEKDQDRYFQIYARRMKERGRFMDMSEEEILAMLYREVDKKVELYLTPEEAVEWGLADGILGEEGFEWDSLRSPHV